MIEINHSLLRMSLPTTIRIILILIQRHLKLMFDDKEPSDNTCLVQIHECRIHLLTSTCFMVILQRFQYQEIIQRQDNDSVFMYLFNPSLNIFNHNKHNNINLKEDQQSPPPPSSLHLEYQLCKDQLWHSLEWFFLFSLQ